MIRTSSLILVLALIGACGKDSASSNSKPEPAPAPVANAEPAPAAPVETPPPELPKLTKKKLAELDTFDWMDILKAAGWTDASSGGMAIGAWKQTTIKAKQGDALAQVTIVAPSGAKDDPKASVTAQSPKEQLAKLQETGAAELLRDDFLVAVIIEGDPEGAQQLLEHIKQWIIVE